MITMSKITAQKRRQIYERDGHRCHYCRITLWVDDALESSPRRATVDHKHPRALGGTDADDNLVACCNLCNNEKGGMYALDIGFKSEHLTGDRPALTRGEVRHG